MQHARLTAISHQQEAGGKDNAQADEAHTRAWPCRCTCYLGREQLGALGWQNCSPPGPVATSSSLYQVNGEPVAVACTAHLGRGHRLDADSEATPVSAQLETERAKSCLRHPMERIAEQLTKLKSSGGRSRRRAQRLTSDPYAKGGGARPQS